jgi:hypothetical protein
LIDAWHTGGFRKPMPKQTLKKSHHAILQESQHRDADAVQQIQSDIEGLEQLQVMQLKLIREIRRQLNELQGNVSS